MRLKRSYNYGIVLCFLCLILSIDSVAQEVEHNFKKGPENTNCHNIDSEFESEEEGIQLIESSSFRFTQHIDISKYRVPNAIYFYSCDGKTGYLIAHESKEVKKLYHGITKDTWDRFIEDRDPIGFYKNKIQPTNKEE